MVWVWVVEFASGSIKSNISTNDNQELKVSSPFVSNVLYEERFKQINGVVQTFDYIEIEDKKFKLIGRSSKILKLAGKRYSTVQIENILEDLDDIQKALVFVKSDENTLRGEYLDITLESQKQYTTSEIKNILKENLSNLKFMVRLKIVKHIPVNQIGKKLRIK
jgi:acyl-coenzyme A synthetase/AMP-(fatty) acid ligase